MRYGTKGVMRTMNRPSSAADLLAGRRLGFACLVRGRRGMKSYDGRKWQNEPHLRVSIGLLRDVFDYLDAIDVRLFRLSSQTAPYIDAGFERLLCRIGFMGSHTVPLNEFSVRVIIGHDNTIKSPLIPQNLLKQPGVSMSRNAVDLVIARIDEPELAPELRFSNIVENGAADRAMARTGSDQRDGMRREQIFQTVSRHRSFVSGESGCPANRYGAQCVLGAAC